MNMAMTSTAAAAAATSMAAAMDMDMGAGACKISMLWNWYTIDACFIARSWHITSNAMFAGSCIGVVLLTLSLEALRRTSKEYDRFILRQYQRMAALPEAQSISITTGGASKYGGVLEAESSSQQTMPLTGACSPASLKQKTFRPNLFQQMIRATLHMVQFGVAYFVMLLAMYYNGYFIICIMLGAWLGAFVFSWESINFGETKEEVTVCCG